jgi:hypothetical protein
LDFTRQNTAQIATPLSAYLDYGALYIQDDFRITPKLTINAGLRYEIETGLKERENHFTVGFDPTVASPLKVPLAWYAPPFIQQIRTACWFRIFAERQDDDSRRIRNLLCAADFRFLHHGIGRFGIFVYHHGFAGGNVFQSVPEWVEQTDRQFAWLADEPGRRHSLR